MYKIADSRMDEFKKAYNSKSQRDKIILKMSKNRFRQALKILFKHPFVIRKGIRNYILSFLGKYPLRSLEVAVGYECNFSCSQCSCVLNRNDKRKRLTIDQFKNAIDQAINMGAFQFNLNGGEPMLYLDDVLELCCYIRSRNCYVHMATNGFFFTSERIRIMKDKGLCSFEMGLDSSVESRHDANRGAGSYRKIIENTEIANKMGLGVAYNTVGSKDKIWNGDLVATIKLAKKNDVLLMITPPCVTGHWAGKMDVLLNDEEQWYIRWLLSEYSHTRIDNYNGLRKLSCPAAREKMALNPYGDIVSCPLIQLKYGNIIDSTLLNAQEKMLEDHFYLKELRDGCLPSHDIEFINKRLINFRDVGNNYNRLR